MTKTEEISSRCTNVNTVSIISTKVQKFVEQHCKYLYPQERFFTQIEKHKILQLKTQFSDQNGSRY